MAETEPLEGEAGSGSVAQVNLSATHQHYVADSAMAMYLGRDCEIAFVRLFPQLTEVQRFEASDKELMRVGFTAETTYTEVARVRLTPDAAITLSMMVLEQMLTIGVVDPTLLRRAVDEMIAKRDPTHDMTEQ